MIFKRVFSLVLVCMLTFAIGCGKSNFEKAKEYHKGICFVTWNKNAFSSPASDDSLKALAATGATWVAIVPTWYQEACESTKIFPTDNTATDASVIHAITTAHSLGLNVMLKPHLDLLDASGGGWRGDIACATEPDWKEWFDSYQKFALHYAKIAEQNKVEIFCFGTELSGTATVKEEMWKDKIIKPIRATYNGPLTYAANWRDEYQHVKFWDVLDYIGIDAYFPLSKNERPTFEEIKKGWEPWAAEMEAFQKTLNKPVLFPEVGYCSAKWTAKTPWEEMTKGSVDQDLQADCYEAFYQIFWNKDWVRGIYWWKWGTNRNFGGPSNRGYTPQNKKAQGIIEKWYHTPKK